MNTENILVLNEQALRAVYSRHPTGKTAYTYTCSVNWGNGDESQNNAFIKRFKKENQQGLVNEITGYILAKHCQLPVPRYAALIKTNDYQFDVKDESFIPWGFVSSALNGKTPQSVYELGDITECKKLLDHIATWGGVAEAIAFDDWIANEDRNSGNIIIEDKNNISLIDHSHFPINLNWKAETLDPLYKAKNKLNETVYGSNCPLPIKSKISEANGNHELCYKKAQEELNYWWDLLLINDQEKRVAIEKFLRDRASLGNQRVNDDLRLLA